MWNEIAAWQERLPRRHNLSAKTVALYTQDERRFATWLQQEHPGLGATEVSSNDAKTYRDHLLAKRLSPTTINRALITIMLFFDTLDGTNPFRHLTMIEVMGPALVVLSKTEWNAVRSCSEHLVHRDHGAVPVPGAGSQDSSRKIAGHEGRSKLRTPSRGGCSKSRGKKGREGMSLSNS